LDPGTEGGATLPGDFDTRFTKIALNGWELDERAAKRLDLDELSKDDHLVHQGKISTALYLAGCQRNRLLAQAIVKTGLFKGTTTSRFLDMKEFDGSLLSLVEDTMEFVARHLSMAVVLDGAPQRKEVWEIPMAAVREAVVNAVLHRDYDDPGNVQVRIFDDRLEVWSPGLLVGSRDLASLGQEVRSIPRNRHLVRLAKSLGLVEAWGTGFQRMTEECRRQGLPLPTWQHKDGAFVTTFRKKRANREGIDEAAASATGNIGGLSGGLSTTQSRVLDLVGRHGGIQAHEIATELAMPLDTTDKTISKLVKLRRIERRGSRKTGGYFPMAPGDTP
jgi:ATP-dependent DNA helicase RecG